MRYSIANHRRVEDSNTSDVGWGGGYYTFLDQGLAQCVAAEINRVLESATYAGSGAYERTRTQPYHAGLVGQGTRRTTMRFDWMEERWDFA